MPVFAWRVKPTRHFGDQPVPYASVALKGRNDRWRGFSLIVDSGAVVSLLCRSVADLLGVPIEAGHQLTLGGVGYSDNEVYLHTLLARIGDGAAFKMRVALSDREDMPNLLGRLDVFDRFEIVFDPKRGETRFAGSRLETH